MGVLRAGPVGCFPQHTGYDFSLSELPFTERVRRVCVIVMTAVNDRQRSPQDGYGLMRREAEVQEESHGAGRFEGVGGPFVDRLRG